MSQSYASTNFDPWFQNYAERTSGLSASEVRALFAVASRPEVVSLAGGMPFVSALPKDLLQETLTRVLKEHGNTALQYGSGQGDIRLREQILEVMKLEGITASPDNVVVTTGSQHALDLVSKLFLDPHDVVLAESPSYVGALGVFRSYQADVQHIAMDDEGIIPSALIQAIESAHKAKKKIKFLYLIPNFQNPAGITLSAQRRIEILEISKKHSILILEDNPYGQLYFNQEPPAALRSIDEDNVIYLGSFSKTLAPGFRVGWALAPHAIREKLILANESAVLSPSNFAQLSIMEYLKHSDWQQQIADFRELYRERKEATISALEDYMPDCQWTKPDGGFYVWLTLPEHLNSKSMLPRAVKKLVAYTPGTAFFADGQGAQHIRLSYCFPTPERIREGIKRLSDVVNQENELFETFAPATGSIPLPKPTKSSPQISTPPPNIG